MRGSVGVAQGGPARGESGPCPDQKGEGRRLLASRSRLQSRARDSFETPLRNLYITAEARSSNT